MYYIKGNYRKSIYKNERGYIIGLFKVRESDKYDDYLNKTVTFTGYFHDLIEGENYIFYGEEIEHPRYGYQFEVKKYEKVKKETKDELVEFLSSELFKGVGEKLAKKIVNTFGNDTINKILENHENLLLIPKVSEKKAKEIYETLKQYELSNEIILYLSKLGFDTKQSLSIYNTYKDNTINVIDNNIYSIINDKVGINFLDIDRLRDNLNIELLDERRILALIIYGIKKITFENGDTYTTFEEIINFSNNYLGEHIDNEKFNYLLIKLNNDKKVVIIDDKYYLREIYEDEVYIANRFKYLKVLKKNSIKNKDAYIKELEKVFNIKYNDDQKKAIINSIVDNLLVITGGPGTGKTTIIQGIIELYKSIYNVSDSSLLEDITLLAPTGRASKRMSEATLLPAVTIHRFLKWNKETNEFAINEYNKISTKIVIIDEVSMIDNNLMASLLRGLYENTKIILIGDYYQLPSVREGQVLKDIIDSGEIDITYLEEIYRQNENSYIVSLAKEIRSKELSDDYKVMKDDYNFIECPNSLIKKSISDICSKIINKNYKEKDIQVLAPMYKGENGIDNINKYLQEVFNPVSPLKNEIKNGNIIYRVGDKILQLTNMPDDNVFNGDIGYITDCISAEASVSKKNEIYVDFDGNIVKYLPKDFINITHGYAISIHKSQGSEFRVIIMPFSNYYNRMLYNKLIYTGISRAKEKLILIGQKEVFEKSVYNDNESKRKTTLKDFLINE